MNKKMGEGTFRVKQTIKFSSLFEDRMKGERGKERAEKRGVREKIKDFRVPTPFWLTRMPRTGTDGPFLTDDGPEERISIIDFFLNSLLVIKKARANTTREAHQSDTVCLR